MDWKPNEEGIQWMLETVWPLIIERIPDIKLYLAGRNMPDWIHETGMHNVVVDGEVENAKKYLCEHQIMIVPLLSAGGMRVKIIEGLALGKVIISTTTGAEGIQYEDGKHLLIANSPEEIAATVQRLTEHPELITEIGCYARKLVEDQYSYLRIGNRLVEFYQTLMK
jgi:glycosyltransferase involved in cell wall biosynthesis